MKNNNIFKTFILLCGVAVLYACNDYLDEIPDNRTEIDSKNKITKLLVSAYSVSSPNILHELMSDNTSDRGSKYGVGYTFFNEAYRFETIGSESHDSPYGIWESNYKAIASANAALQAIEKLSVTEELSAQKGEALLCRAYAHFTLCNAFCQAYNTESGPADLGIPYMYEVETTAINTYTRGTVEEVYQKINEDIEEGLPLINDDIYTQPKYHFNKRAAYAFAAQFNLYYGNYDKVIDYADKAIGENPTSLLRDYSVYKSFTTTSEITSGWINSGENANIFLQGINSLGGRMYSSRFVLTNDIHKEIIASTGPWKSSAYSDHLIFYNYAYHTQYTSNLFPKQTEYFVYTDQVNGVGFPYIMLVPFTTEKTLIDRAEAYTMLGQFEKAARDLSYFYVGSGADAAIDAKTISNYYDNASSTHKKKINPRFTITPGDQENFIHACLHARRIYCVHDGTRFLDIKRYGIAYEHVIDKEAAVSIKAFDKRLALQIPALVIEAGMEANPR